MVDYQRIIDNIRSILASAETASLEFLSATAAEYAEACDHVNERLRKCSELLREGLRSEAIQQSEAEPNLLSLVATLDCPEVGEWTALLSVKQLPPPVPLLVDDAAELNEAYGQEQPLAALLRRHRLLALSRRPLRDRISTLRKLAKLDANNLVWPDDLRTYEKARQQEIRRAAEQEYKQGNLAALEELVHDVQSADWLARPPSALVQQVCSARTRLMHAQARSELETIEPQLNNAFSQFDAALGRTLRDRWNSSAKVADLSQDDPLYDRAAPALEWLGEQDRAAADEDGYKTAVAELEHALDNEAGLASLERRANAILRYDRPIPPVVEQRLRTRMAGLELAKASRRRLIIGGVVAAIVLIGSGIGYTLFSHAQAEQVAAHVSALKSLIEKAEFDEAQKHLDQLRASSPGIASHGEIQGLGVELATRMREEETRRENFARAIEAAETAGAGQSDRKSLEDARRLAKFDSEKARVQTLESAIAAVDRQRQAQRDEGFLRRLNELKARLDAIDHKNPDKQALGEVRRGLANLITESDGITAAVMDQNKSLQARIESLNETSRRLTEAETALAAIDRSVGDGDGFKQALEDFVGKFPESAQAMDFKRVANEVVLWKEVEAWDHLIRRWNKNDVTHLDSAQAKELLTACSEILIDHGSYPAAAELRRRLPHLEAIIRRADGNGQKLHSNVNELFTDPLVAGLWMVKTVDDKENVIRYYLVSAPRRPAAGEEILPITVIVDLSRVATKKIKVATKFIKYSDRAPQSLVAKAALDEIAGIKDQSWEATFFKIVREIKSQEHMEPILKVIFLQRVLEVACQGSESLRSAFEPFRELLGSAPIDPAIPWMDPDNRDAKLKRSLAEDVLARLPNLDQIGDDAAKNFKAFKSPPYSQYTWVGWLALERDGSWQCRLKNRSLGVHELFVAQPTGDSQSLIWSAIGRDKAGKIDLDRVNSLSFVQGRPVFANKSELELRQAARN